ncbi:MAG: cytochrome C556 [Mesorhizobium amorphae]|nr:MAG: cytochrome C556 [Mesorhizobium amorphae]
MKKLSLALSLLAATAAAAFANPVEEREAIMKERGGLLRQLAPIARGEAPFDQAAAQALLVKLDENAHRDSVEALFPEGTQAGSEASPRIWEDMNGYKALWAKYADTTAAAVAAAPQDQAALQAAFGTIAATCSGCHQTYRISN